MGFCDEGSLGSGCSQQGRPPGGGHLSQEMPTGHRLFHGAVIPDSRDSPARAASPLVMTDPLSLAVHLIDEGKHFGNSAKQLLRHLLTDIQGCQGPGEGWV